MAVIIFTRNIYQEYLPGISPEHFNCCSQLGKGDLVLFIFSLILRPQNTQIISIWNINTEKKPHPIFLLNWLLEYSFLLEICDIEFCNCFRCLKKNLK